MKSNRFGSFLQHITVLVPATDGDKAAALFGSAAEELPPEGSNQVFAWPHLGRRLGDDERVVFDLCRILGDEVAWSIDWGCGSY